MSTYNKGEAVQLSKNFKSTEFDCRCSKCKKTTIDLELVKILQKMRTHFRKPILINSGYRCSYHNTRVGGSPNSKHRTGQAADIQIKGVQPLEIAKYAEYIGVQGIGLYDTFVHVDTRLKKSFWYSHDQIKRTTFRTNLRKVAEDVIDGKYGTGTTRKKKLEAAGYNYREVQDLVNELLREK